MNIKTKQPDTFQSAQESASDAEMERYLVEHHDEIQAKLDEARTEIAAGQAAPLEPLSEMLRQARKQSPAKAPR